MCSAFNDTKRFENYVPSALFGGDFGIWYRRANTTRTINEDVTTTTYKDWVVRCIEEMICPPSCGSFDTNTQQRDAHQLRILVAMMKLAFKSGYPRGS